MKRFLLILLTSSIAINGYAWGPKGHDAIAYIAECNLKKSTKKRVEAILDNKSMVYVANWMDNASHTSEYEHTKTWHYCNVDPEEQSYAESQKAKKGDVVSAINLIVENLQSGELSKEQERIELMMLIHLVGDMHCPMHAGHKSDLGGNRVSVKFFGKKKNLHSVWDSEIVESAHKWSHTEWQRQVDRISKREKRAIRFGTPNEWIEESVVLADDIYKNSPADATLSYDYVHKYAPIVEEQFLKGGLRLAEILEQIY